MSQPPVQPGRWSAGHDHRRRSSSLDPRGRAPTSTSSCPLTKPAAQPNRSRPEQSFDSTALVRGRVRTEQVHGRISAHHRLPRATRHRKNLARGINCHRSPASTSTIPRTPSGLITSGYTYTIAPIDGKPSTERQGHGQFRCPRSGISALNCAEAPNERQAVHGSSHCARAAGVVNALTSRSARA